MILKLLSTRCIRLDTENGLIFCSQSLDYQLPERCQLFSQLDRLSQKMFYDKSRDQDLENISLERLSQELVSFPASQPAASSMPLAKECMVS